MRLASRTSKPRLGIMHAGSIAATSRTVAPIKRHFFRDMMTTRTLLCVGAAAFLISCKDGSSPAEGGIVELPGAVLSAPANTDLGGIWLSVRDASGNPQ